MTCIKCRDTGRKHLRTLPTGERVHSDFLDCHHCDVADSLAQAERERRMLSGIVMRADALYPGYKIPTKEQEHA